jgi:hypothetical protein
MPAAKRNSLRINFGNRDPLDALLFETVCTVAQGSACGRAAAAKRLMTLGTLLFNGYDPRLITDRLPKQKIIWADVIWPLLRDYAAAKSDRAAPDAGIMSDMLSTGSKVASDVAPPVLNATVPRASARTHRQHSVAALDEREPAPESIVETAFPPSPQFDIGKFKFP